MGLRSWAAKAPIAHLDDVYLYPDRVKRLGKEKGEFALAGVQASVESVGELQRRVTVTRMALTGPFAFALKKKRDERDLFLTIEGPDFQWVIEVDPKKGADARQFAAKINTAARQGS